MKKISVYNYMTSILFLSLITLTQIGCNKNGSNPIIITPGDELLSAPEKIEIDGQEFILDTYLWRDFMPISPDDGKDMAAVVYIATADSTEFPPDISADKLWVINNQSVWEANLAQSSQYDYNFRIKRSAWGGPKWGPGIKVDVVVRLIDNNGNTYYVKQIGVDIDRTE